MELCHCWRVTELSNRAGLSNREYTRLVEEERYPEDPCVPLDEPFVNQAGSIVNLLLEKFTSAALIRSNAYAIRANHYHKTDWHYSLVVSGCIVYGWRPAGSRAVPEIRRFVEGQMFFSPPMVEHVMYFPVESSFVTFARNVRDHESHEADVVRVTPLLKAVWVPADGAFRARLNEEAVDPAELSAHLARGGGGDIA